MNGAAVIIFMLGIGNFAMHRAVMESGHPLLQQLPGVVHPMGRWIAFGTEYLILLVALMLATNGWPMIGWVYASYSACNAFAAWLMLSGRV